MWTTPASLYELRPVALQPQFCFKEKKKSKKHYLLSRGQKANFEDWLNSTLSKSMPGQGTVKVWTWR